MFVARKTSRRSASSNNSVNPDRRFSNPVRFQMAIVPMSRGCRRSSSHHGFFSPEFDVCV